MGKASQDLFEGGQQRGRFRLVAIKHFMVNRQTFCGLHHAQHELALNQSGLGHAVFAHIVGLRGQARRPDSGEVIKDKRQILINQWAQ